MKSFSQKINESLDANTNESAESFIKDIANDYQFDKKSDDYIGHLNITPKDHGKEALDMVDTITKYNEYMSLLKKNKLKLQPNPSKTEMVFIAESLEDVNEDKMTVDKLKKEWNDASVEKRKMMAKQSSVTIKDCSKNFADLDGDDQDSLIDQLVKKVNEDVNEALNYSKLAKQFVDDEWLDEDDDIDDADEYFDDKLNLFNKEELKNSKEFDNNKTKMSIEVKKLLKGKLKTIFESVDDVNEAKIDVSIGSIVNTKDLKNLKIVTNAKSFSNLEDDDFEVPSVETVKGKKWLGVENKDGKKIAIMISDIMKNVSESASDINEAKISSDAEFIEYGEKLLKKAHGDNYDQSKADKTLKGILKDNDGDYGACVGALQGGMAEDAEAEKVDEGKTELEIGKILKFKDGETWKIVKPGINQSRAYVVAVPFGKTKNNYVSSAIEFTKKDIDDTLESVVNEGKDIVVELDNEDDAPKVLKLLDAAKIDFDTYMSDDILLFDKKMEWNKAKVILDKNKIDYEIQN